MIGGVLLAHFWWGSAFLINVPVMLVVAPLVFLLLPRTEQTTPGSWGLGQALLLIIGMLALVYGIKAAIGTTHSSGIALAAALGGAGLLALFAHLQLRSATPMLDLSLFSRPAILAGMMMAFVATGTLAGVELTLAQELQYVLGRTPLQAGIFMIPIMAAAAVGGPVAGYFSNLCGLRTVASSSLALSAGTLCYLAQADFHHPGIGVPTILALLGLTLSIGLTASSIAIMGSVETDKGGSSGLAGGDCLRTRNRTHLLRRLHVRCVQPRNPASCHPDRATEGECHALHRRQLSRRPDAGGTSDNSAH